MEGRWPPCPYTFPVSPNISVDIHLYSTKTISISDERILDDLAAICEVIEKGGQSYNVLPPGNNRSPVDPIMYFYLIDLEPILTRDNIIDVLHKIGGRISIYGACEILGAGIMYNDELVDTFNLLFYQ